MRVFKYTFNPEIRENAIFMPAGAKILSAKVVGNNAQLWASVSPSSSAMVNRRVLSVETGKETLVDSDAVFLDTLVFDDGAYIVHIFIVPE